MTSRRTTRSPVTAPSPSESRRVGQRDLAAGVVLWGFVLAVVAHFVLRAYYSQGYPFDTPLFRPSENFTGDPSVAFGVHLFGDFYQGWHQAGQASPYVSDSKFYRSNYPPASHLLLLPFSLLPYRVALLLFLLVVAVGVAWLVHRHLPGRGAGRVHAAVVIALLNYPLLFLLDRGNIDGLVFLLVGAALLQPVSSAWLRPALLGVAAAVKIYPAVFAVLLVRERQWRQLGVFFASGVLSTGAALLTFEGGPIKGLRDFRAGLQEFSTAAAAESVHYVQHTASLVSGSKALVFLDVVPVGTVSAARLLSIALFVGLAAALLLLPLDRWQQLFLVATMITICTEAAYDYRLIFFLLPLVCLLRDGAGDASGRHWWTVALALVLVPKSLPILYEDVAVGVVLNPLLVLGVSVAILVTALRARRAELSWSALVRCGPSAAQAASAAAAPPSGRTGDRAPRSTVSGRRR